VTAPEGDGRAGPAGPARRLSSGEVSAILQRASLVETHVALPAPYDPTVEDLVQAAREVGLDPALVRRAAAVVPVPESGPSVFLFGAEDRIRVRADLRAPMPERRQALVRAAEHALGSAGEVTESDPDGFVWKGSGTLVRNRVTLRRAQDGLSLEVLSDRTGRYLLYWGISFLTLATLSGAVGGLATLGSMSPLLLLAVPALLPVLMARPFWKRAQHRARERVELLGMELARLVEEDPAARSDRGVETEPET